MSKQGRFHWGWSGGNRVGWRTAAVCVLLMLAIGAGVVGGRPKAGQPLPQGAMEDEILTMEAVDPDRTMITVHYEYGVPYGKLEAMIEERFPEAELVMLHDGTNGSAQVLRQNLIHGVEADLIFSRNLPAVSDLAADYLVDFSSRESVGNYYLTALDACIDGDGRLYCLPGPSDVYGVVYDRTMFQENGWSTPHSYTEFVALIDRINRAGLTAQENLDGQTRTVTVKALQPALMFADAFQIVFNTFAYPLVYSGADNQRWLVNYQEGRESMVGHMEPAAEMLKRLAEDGVLSTEDFGVRPRWRSQMLYASHSTAMIFENQNARFSNGDFAGSTQEPHEMGMFPFWISDAPDGDYLYAIPGYYIAVNRAAVEQGGERARLAMEIVDYLNQPEAQNRLVSGGMQISNVQGVQIQTDDFSREIRGTIEEHRIIQNFYLAGKDSVGVVEWALRDGAAALLAGDMTTEEWLRSADDARDRFLSGERVQEVFGRAECTLTRFETVQMMADVYRAATGAPIALAYSGYGSEGITGRVYQGEITEETLECISPTVPTSASECRIVSGTMTGGQIMDALSGAADGAGYVLASGLQVKFAPWNAPGERLIECALPDGSALEPDRTYRVAYLSGSIRTTDGEVFAAPDETAVAQGWRECFLDWLERQNGVISAPEPTTELIWTQRAD